MHTHTESHTLRHRGGRKRGRERDRHTYTETERDRERMGAMTHVYWLEDSFRIQFSPYRGGTEVIRLA